MARTIEEGFETFLGRLVPLTTEHNKAASHKDSVKSCLENNFACTNFFETGSFGNGTGVRHYSDTDYFAVCPTKNLKKDSALTLRQVKEALQQKFWSTAGIEVKTPAVKIPFGQYTSETLEVTLCDFQGLVDTPLGKKAVYDIAAYGGEWMRSSPQAHNAYVKQQDERLGYKLKPLIRLVKAWKFYNNVPIRSFYLELRITKYAENEKSIVFDVDLLRIMRQLNSIELAGIRDPMGISGSIAPCSTIAKRDIALSKLSNDLKRAENAYTQKDSNLDDCFYWWNMFFNYKFPSR